MATTFGTRPEDTVADSRGNVLSGVALTLYATKSDATAQTSVIATVTTNSRGLWSYTDASARSGLWARDPGGNVWAVAAEEQQAVIDGKASQTALNNVVNGTTSLGTLYRPNPSLVASLPNPAYIAHRGGGGTAPEATMEAFRASLGAGADGIEMDIQPLADGGLAVIHDTTVDRTTDGTGSVSAFTTGSWKVLNAAAKFPWGGRVVAPPIWREVVAEFGGRAVVMVEPKDAPNYADIHAAMAAHKLQGSVIIATSTTSVLSAAKADGYAVYFYWGGSIASPTPASVVALGADFLGIDGVARPDAEVTTLVATGKPVFPYTINRRVRAAQLLALGVKGFLSDHPFYLKRTTALQTYDSWRYGVVGPGLNVSGTSATPVIASGYIDTNSPTAACGFSVGEVCPLANAAGTYTIDIDVAFATLPADTTKAISVSFGIADDGDYPHNGAANSFPNEYRAYLRANGQMSLYNVTAGTGGSFTQLGTTKVTDAMTAGGFAHLRISVTPTTVRMQRTDGTAGDTGAIADAAYRGGYLVLSKNASDANARFKNLAIT